MPGWSNNIQVLLRGCLAGLRCKPALQMMPLWDEQVTAVGRTKSHAISHRSARNGLSNFLQRPVDLVVRLQLPLLRDERIPQGINFSHTRIVVAGPYGCLYEYKLGARIDDDPLTVHTL